MNHPIRIAIISDLHIGRKARAADLNPHATETETTKTIKPFLNKFVEFIKHEEIKADYLVIAGDISTESLPQEFIYAGTIILEIADVLGIKNNKIIFVPGNHDVDWNVLNLRKQNNKPEDKTDLRIKQRYDPIKFVDFFKSINSSSGLNGLFEEPYIGYWEFDDICFVGYNSAWHDDPCKDIHSGLISEEHLKELRGLLKTKDIKNKAKVFVTHHHPVPHAEPDFTMDFSAMQNSDKLLTELDKYRFDVIIHGHKHYPRIKHYDHGSCHQMIIIAAGSFSAKLETHLEHTANMFHQLTFDGRYKEKQTIQGSLSSWAYNPEGWYQARQNAGVKPHEPFGYYSSLSELSDKVSTCISTSIAAKGSVKWSAMCHENPDLKYVDTNTLEALFRELKNNNVCEIHETDEEVIFLKRD
jgi:3',5'-cyclic AMP phosphodiesterase CpdA